MLIKLPKASDCHESDVTPESFYLSRRALLGGALAGMAASTLPRWASAEDASRYADVEAGRARAGLPTSCRAPNGRLSR